MLRLKGWLPLADGAGPPQAGGRWLSLQWAGRHASVRRLATPPAGGAALVAIGLAGRLPVETLALGLAACAVDTPPA